jgi:hypothetical protein
MNQEDIKGNLNVLLDVLGTEEAINSVLLCLVEDNALSPSQYDTAMQMFQAWKREQRYRVNRNRGWVTGKENLKING